VPILAVKTRILAGGRVEIPSTGLPEGGEATVRIVVEDAQPRRKLSEILADYPGGRLFGSVEEVDRYLQEERDSWGD
jgi:hypothetical protein